MEVNGVRGREYPWGVAEGMPPVLITKHVFKVENESHCDFVKLRNLLIR